ADGWERRGPLGGIAPTGSALTHAANFVLPPCVTVAWTRSSRSRSRTPLDPLHRSRLGEADGTPRAHDDPDTARAPPWRRDCRAHPARAPRAGLRPVRRQPPARPLGPERGSDAGS